jgi:hypothetical protein
VLSRAQVLGAGLTDAFVKAQCDAGRWRWVHPGVYATTNAEPSRTAEIWAALLHAGEDAIASHETAAELWGLAEPALTGTTVHVTVDAGRRLDSRPGVRLHRSTRVEQVRHPARLPPVSRIEETVLDLSDMSEGFEQVVSWVTRACQRRRTRPSRIAAAMGERSRLRWRKALTELLADVSDGAETPLELRYLRTVERPHRLPAGDRQRHRRVGKQSQWSDVSYGAYGLIVELDGRIGHEADSRFRDHKRDNYSTAAEGCDTLRYGWADADHRPCEVAAEVATVLGRNGWHGRPRRCGPGCALGQDLGGS